MSEYGVDTTEARPDISEYLAMAVDAGARLRETGRDDAAKTIIMVLNEAYRKDKIPNLALVLGRIGLGPVTVIQPTSESTPAIVDERELEEPVREMIAEVMPEITSDIGKEDPEKPIKELSADGVRALLTEAFGDCEAYSDKQLHQAFINAGHPSRDTLCKLHPGSAKSYSTNYQRAAEKLKGRSAPEIAAESGISVQMVHNSRRDVIKALQKAFTLQELLA